MDCPLNRHRRPPLRLSSRNSRTLLEKVGRAKKKLPLEKDLNSFDKSLYLEKQPKYISNCKTVIIIIAWQWVGCCLGRALIYPHDCPPVLKKGVKITPCPTLSIPSALRNSSREEELKRSCSWQSNHHTSVSQTPALFWGNPMNCHLSNTSGVFIWNCLAWNCMLSVHYFFFSPFKEKKKKIGRWLNTLTPRKTFTKITGSSSREKELRWG